MTQKPTYEELEKRINELEQAEFERSRSDEALRKVEVKYRLLADNVSDVIWTMDMEQRFTYFSPSIQKFWGYTPEEALQIPLENTLTPESYEKAVSIMMEELALEGKPGVLPDRSRIIELEHIRKDGGTVWGELTTSFIRDEGGLPSGIIGVTRDITERRQAEESFRKNEARIKSIFRAASIGIGVVINRVIQDVNVRFCEITGYSRDELTGQSARMIYPNEEDFENVGREKYRQINEQGTGAVETRFKRKDGRIIDVLLSSTPLDLEDLSKGVTFTALDITKRKQAEKELKESEEKFRVLYYNSPDMYVSVSPDEASILLCNEMLLKKTGYSREEIIGFPIFKIYHDDCLEEVKKVFQQFVETGVIQDKELILKRKDGSKIDVSLNVNAVKDKAGEILYSISSWRDITERKQSENRLRESEEKYRSIMEAMDDAAYICSPDFRIEYTNPAMTEMIGHDAAGEPCYQAIHGLDEKCLWCSHAAVMEGKRIKKEIISPKNGKTYHITSSPVFHIDGSISNLTIFHDITEIKKVEAQFRQAQKMESVGRLAGGVAHDYNNALSVIIGFTELAINDVDPAGLMHDNLNEVLKAAKRATDITRQLLAFARKQIIAPKVLDLNRNVESMLSMLRRLIGEDIALAWLPGMSLWPVKMDPSQIDQVLANLCVNARDAIEDVGKLTIETKNVTFDATYCDDHSGFVPGEFVLLAVSDNGCGMEKEILDKIFEPFFTTKDVDKGTGLGLATVYGIAKQNNGFINVYSEPGKGTTIRIYIPRYEGKAVETQEESTAEIPQGRGETILVVEDDLPILKLTNKILNGLGYIVLTATTPAEAMGLAEEHADGIHLLVTDVIMPGMNGRELAQQLQSLYPRLKCVFMSGYTANAIAHHGVLDEGVLFIQKPLSKKGLATTVRKALDE